MELRSPRLRMERLHPHHYAELRRMHEDDRVMLHLGGPQDEAWTRGYLTRNLAHWDAHNYGLWIVYERDGREPIGRALLRHLDVAGVDEVETGYAFYETYWGRGYATEVTQACLAMGFGELNRPSIVAVTTLENTASQHVLTKCGMHFERSFARDDETLALFRIARPTATPPV